MPFMSAINPKLYTVCYNRYEQSHLCDVMVCSIQVYSILLSQVTGLHYVNIVYSKL